MKKLLVWVALFLITGCAALKPVYKVEVKRDDIRDRGTRQEKFFNCITRLNREGIRQSLIKDLCNATWGSIND